MFRNSIIVKLLFLFFLVGFISLAIIGTYSYFKAKQAILKRALEQLTSIRVIKKNEIEFFFNEKKKNIELFSHSTTASKLAEILLKRKLQDSSEYPVNELLNQFGYNRFHSFYLVKRSGDDQYFYYSISDSKLQIERTPKLCETLKNITNSTFESGNALLTDLIAKSPADSLPSCYLGIKLPLKNLAESLTLVIEIPVAEINSIMLEKSLENGLGNSGEAYLVGKDYLMRSSSRFIPNSVLTIPVKSTSTINAFGNKTGTDIITDYRGVKCLSSFSMINVAGLEWAIIAEIDHAEAMIPIINIRNDLLLLSLLISIFIFSIAQIISRTITQPLIRLKNAAVKIGEGSFDIKLETKSRDEIGVLTTTVNQMSEQLKAERQNRMSSLYDGQEIERHRVSRELHDGLGQMLVGMKIRLENSIYGCDEEGKKKLASIRENFIEIIDEIKRISNDLAPAGIDDFGLIPAISLLCREAQATSGIKIEFAAFGHFDGLPTRTVNYIYRIAQEALNNAIRHSKASLLDMQLTNNLEYIILMIEDNGTGFNMQDIKQPGGNGLFNMKQRISLLGGNFDLESEEGKGTTIRVKIPLNFKGD